MPMILAMNGADFGEFGAASQAILELQTALVALGKGIGDTTLAKIVTDGLIGPKTTAATNRALTVHLGPGQAPANLRTGSLSQTTINSQAPQIAQLIEAEVRRRGFNLPVAKKAPVKKAAVPAVRSVAPAASAAAAVATAPVQYNPTAAAMMPTAMTPVYRAPVAPPSSAGNMDSIIKWSAIGVGAVALAGLAYWIITKKPQPARARA